jgi:hypothetical protein
MHFGLRGQMEASNRRTWSINREIVVPGLTMTCDHLADDARCEIAEGDPVTAVAVSRVNAWISWHFAYKRKTILGFAKGPGPDEIRSRIGLRA